MFDAPQEVVIETLRGLLAAARRVIHIGSPGCGLENEIDATLLTVEERLDLQEASNALLDENMVAWRHSRPETGLIELRARKFLGIQIDEEEEARLVQRIGTLGPGALGPGVPLAETLQKVNKAAYKRAHELLEEQERGSPVH